MSMELRKLTIHDGDDVYELLQSLPANENGFMNGMAGCARDEFRTWLQRNAESAEKTELIDGWRVPQTVYWLYKDGRPVGMGKLRHFLTDFLRQGGGHIGYAIAPDARGMGCGTALLRGLLKEAALLGIERVLVTVQNSNPASIRVALKCGGEIERVTEDHHYIWISTGERLQLVEPSEAYAADIWAFRQEVLEVDANDEDHFAGCMSLDTVASAEEWIRICRLRKDQATCQQTGVDVPSSMYLGVRQSDGRIVGTIDLRYHIDHPILGLWGGHCGYTVRPSERGKRYAAKMLKLNLHKARRMGIERMLITCSASNIASERTILANGGVYESSVSVDGREIKRYWIDLQP